MVWTSEETGAKARNPRPTLGFRHSPFSYVYRKHFGGLSLRFPSYSSDSAAAGVGRRSLGDH